ncbi:MAG TPA: hypothetical protein PLB41_10130 [Rubrivivax sp.]|nr:hypothetical protein [Rubrivivax sp.]
MKPDPAHHLAAADAAGAAPIAAMPAELGLCAERPWPGMRPYSERDAHFFFGRAGEVDELLARTERSLLTLLYARGGLGKTSLLRAGLAPRLLERGWLPVYLRPRGLLEGARDPIAETVRAVQAAARAAGIEATADFEVPGLWELFHRADFDLWDAANRLVVPVLVLDQFEEIFQIIDDDAAAAPRVRALLDGIAELVDKRVPRRLAGGAAGAAAQRFDVASKDYRVVLSFREDYLPQVHKLRAIVPSVIDNHVRLEALNARQALQVVEGAGGDLIGRDAAALLVQSVGRPAGLLQRLLDADSSVAARGEAVSVQAINVEAIHVEVEPAILSVVCFHLNAERLQRGKAAIDVGLVRHKSAEDIFDDYYRASIGAVDAAAREFVESRLVTSGGARVLYPMREAEALGPGLNKAMAQLVDQGILRKEWFAGEQRLEISHDLLLRPIRRAVESRRRQAARSRRTRRAAAGLAAVLAAAGAAAAWYAMQLRLDAELAQRDSVTQALLVAYVPLSADPANPERLKSTMVELIAAVDAAAGRAERAQRLEQLFDWTVGVSASADGRSALRLRDFALDYVQLKIDLGGFDRSAVAALVGKLRDAAAQSCAEGLLLPDDRAVEWFADWGGLPAACRP